MKVLNAFIKPFEAPQRNVKITILSFAFLVQDQDRKGYHGNQYDVRITESTQGTS